MRGGTVADSHDERRTILKGQIEARLRPLCSHFPQRDFDRMVEHIVDAQLQGERRAVNWGR